MMAGLSQLIYRKNLTVDVLPVYQEVFAVVVLCCFVLFFTVTDSL